MTLAIEQAMDKDIDSLDWMSAATKVKAKEKLHAVMNKIGYPDKWRDYSTVKIVRGDRIGQSDAGTRSSIRRGIWRRSASRWTRANGR